jgi:hypothetical protein
LTTTTFAADENTNVASPSVGTDADLTPATLQLTAGRPPTSCATAGPITRAIGDLCNSLSTLGRTARSAARSGMCELAAVWATATPSPDGPAGSATPVEKAAPLVVTGPTRVPAATKPRGIR